MFNKPNIFDFATNELTQDAFFSWLFLHYNTKNENLVEFQISKQLLLSIDGVEKNIDRIELENQTNKIDILLTLKYKESEILLIIEDKVYSGESKDKQLEVYQETIENRNKFKKIILVYLKTGLISKAERESFKNRNIVIIDIILLNDIFSKLINNKNYKKSEIILDWWSYFNEKFVKQYYLYSNFNEEIFKNVSFKKFFDHIALSNESKFELFVSYFSKFFSKGYELNHFPSQGKGHIDWHIEVTKENWRNLDIDFQVGFYGIYDGYSFKFTLKAHTHEYKPKIEISKSDLHNFEINKEKLRGNIGNCIKNVKLDWNLQYYYLQFLKADINESETIEAITLNLREDIDLISQEIDFFFSNKV